ncbi:unnamed protein product [Schistocephalus solidus]|uniref:Uncharacterized protein n=1 Tax=Schistocephalus solidus TaxID=70667 RepID=A0A183TP36_SCHSO|nr:unnamed protein product [Schistocephalus solidus]
MPKIDNGDEITAINDSGKDRQASIVPTKNPSEDHEDFQIWKHAISQHKNRRLGCAPDFKRQPGHRPAESLFHLGCLHRIMKLRWQDSIPDTEALEYRNPQEPRHSEASATAMERPPGED